MPHCHRRHAHRALWGLIATFGLGGAVLADDDRRAHHVPLAPKYQQECSTCHLAYPPGMLPAASWERILSNLQRHYGTDASLDASTAKELSAWLTANTGTGKRGREQPPEDRITRSTWFVREHIEVPPNTWKLSAVKSASNCAACHAQANQGQFNEHTVRMPR
jgi:hypothetical protein